MSFWSQDAVVTSWMKILHGELDRTVGSDTNVNYHSFPFKSIKTYVTPVLIDSRNFKKWGQSPITAQIVG